MYKHWDRIFAKRFCHVVRFCLPIEVKGVHIIVGRSASFFDVVMPLVKYLLGKEIRLRTVIHRDRHVPGIEAYGIDRVYLPVDHGGMYKIGEAHSSIEPQRLLEPKCRVGPNKRKILATP